MLEKFSSNSNHLKISWNDWEIKYIEVSYEIGTKKIRFRFVE